MSRAHSFNSVHGRMPSVATGALLANRSMISMGVSGDGDTASIGMGQFIHLMRRNLPIIYIIEDNGVYGLTKGQFSATADRGSKQKSGVLNDLPAIDTCVLAIQMGATFVARSFSGDKKQLLTMLKAAIAHRGTVMLDVISPCVTFNDHEGSTKSYKYVQEHEEAIAEAGFVPHFEDISVDYDPGSTFDVQMHDGSHLRQRKRNRAISPDLESGFSPRRFFSNLERVPQRPKPDFRPVLTARLRFAEAVPLQNLRKPRNTPANLDSLAACCVSTKPITYPRAVKQ